MPLRDIALSLILAVLIPMCALRPWWGIMVWSWIGYMNPHRIVWSFARDLPWAMAVALATFVGILFARDEEKRPIPWTPETVLLALLWFWYFVTTVFAWYPADAWPQLEKVSKILLFVFLTLKFFQVRYRLHALFLLIALSIGFYGLKGGVWSLFISGGAYHVLGPEDTFIEGNTALGLALNMTLPFLWYLAKLERRQWLRRLLQVTFGFSVLSVIFTYSRGAVLGLPIVLLMIFAGSKRRLLGITALVFLYFFVINFAPREWFEKMETIQTYEEDESARGRLTSWKVATLLALDSPITGGGFWVLPHKDVFFTYAPGYPFRHSAHSIYFSVLGDHGFPGLAIFLGLILYCHLSLFMLRRRIRDKPGGAEIIVYSRMIEASLAAYAISGAFLTMAYFDMFYHLVSFVVLIQVIAQREGLLARARSVPAPAAAAGPAPVPGRRLVPGYRRAPALLPGKGPVT
jgi:putative inorganic carbon (hco3(-)) transporter